MGAISTLITPRDLTIAIGSSSGPVILDVRRAPAFEKAIDMIATADWHDPAHIDEWADDLSDDHDYVVYCVHGHEVSQNAAAALRSKGVRARYLEGGIDAFRDSGGPMMERTTNAK
jgi:Fe-Mn family superoxide dismutase